MFELPEYITLASQMNETLMGKKIKRGVLGNAPHKFVWYNRKHAVGKPRPECGRKTQKMQYLGGACYFYPTCQK